MKFSTSVILFSMQRVFQVIALVLLLWIGIALMNMRHFSAAAISPQKPDLSFLMRVPQSPIPVLTLERIVEKPITPHSSSLLTNGSERPQLILRGVLKGSQWKAYIEEKTTGQIFTVAQGDTIGVAAIQTIEENRVVVKQEGETYELRL